MSPLPDPKQRDSQFSIVGDERGLSPVVSVILLIAVAVVVIGAIAAFMFNIGGVALQPGAPNVQLTFDWDADDGELTITHDGGPVLTDENTHELEIYVNGERTETWANASDGTLPVQAGDDIAVTEPDAGPGDTVRVVWIGPDAQQTATLANFNIPA